ncbi:MAG: hypothetical protein ACE5RJ_05915 [Nitrosopumilaceae archaeon]
MTEKITKEDRERVEFLQIISSSKNAFKELSLEQLERLRELVEKKDYSHNKKAHKSKVKLLSKINVRIFELEDEKKYSKAD